MVMVMDMDKVMVDIVMLINNMGKLFTFKNRDLMVGIFLCGFCSEYVPV